MNSLSWMLYLADAGQSVSILATLTGLVFLAVAAAKTASVWTGDFERGTPKTKATARAVFLGAGKVAVPLLLLSALIPSKSTIYAIAASEMGEAALNTPTATKAMKALDAWLDRQIDGEEK